MTPYKCNMAPFTTRCGICIFRAQHSAPSRISATPKDTCSNCQRKSGRNDASTRSINWRLSRPPLGPENAAGRCRHDAVVVRAFACRPLSSLTFEEAVSKGRLDRTSRETVRFTPRCRSCQRRLARYPPRPRQLDSVHTSGLERNERVGRSSAAKCNWQQPNLRPSPDQSNG
ncbi:hypothetical protein Poly51_48140 [Rubripirellula tenax]|uniref:Uncharacterized protein n=1 Tax=Rubripirellula tenax TaxID=2528015 RepID=A0A5C6EK88_9BACT|nr:hypothetical protein Poly51_48140 [Rubripirellula tenax]